MADVRFVGVLVDGDLTVHAAPAPGPYDTLCGLDADDDSVGHERAYVKRGDRKITCAACWGLVQQAKTYRTTDFTNEARNA